MKLSYSIIALQTLAIILFATMFVLYKAEYNHVTEQVNYLRDREQQYLSALNDTLNDLNKAEAELVELKQQLSINTDYQ